MILNMVVERRHLLFIDHTPHFNHTPDKISRRPRQILNIIFAKFAVWNMDYLSTIRALEYGMCQVDFLDNELHVLLFPPDNPVTNIVRMLYEDKSTSRCKIADWSRYCKTEACECRP